MLTALFGGLLAEVPPAASELEGAYRQALTVLDGEREQQVQGLSKGYIAAVERQKGVYQQAGDLGGMISAKNEHSRFEKVGGPPGTTELAAFAEVRTLQGQLTQAFLGVDKQYHEKAHALRLQYINQLASLVTELTRGGEIDAAVAVRDYREEVVAATQAPSQPVVEVRNPQPPNSPVTLNGDLTLNGKRYRIVDQQVSWSDARRAARAAGGDLVVLTSKKEHDLLMEALDGKRSWIGGMIPTGRKPEVWVDGTPMKPIKGVRYRNNGDKKVNQYMTITPDNLMDDYHDVSTDRIPVYIIQF